MDRPLLGRAYFFSGLVLLTISLLLQSIAASAGKIDWVLLAASVSTIGIMLLFLGVGVLLFHQRSVFFDKGNASSRAGRLFHQGLAVAKLAFFAALVVVIVDLALVFMHGDGIASQWIMRQAYLVFLILLPLILLLDWLIHRAKGKPGSDPNFR
ncbi:MAG: hypothetical protein B7Z66_12325 [Chromatiales bacterium 21-64-14]|nr:MAG: hypothetical protein B7Z66_12325 [Chromatiales bacterium 21-64-14]HQU16980.1 hypothetical protein [Gammaproteobacteria bacterium]